MILSPSEGMGSIVARCAVAALQVPVVNRKLEILPVPEPGVRSWGRRGGCGKVRSSAFVGLYWTSVPFQETGSARNSVSLGADALAHVREAAPRLSSHRLRARR